MKHCIQLLAVVMLLSLGASVPSWAEGTASWQVLTEPRTHILMRHTEAPGTGDPDGFQLGVCATQRNLSDAGRDQARRIGKEIKDQGIKVDHVLTSQWCRASETAALLDVGRVVEDAALNSFFGAPEDGMEQSADVKRRLSEFDPKGERAVLVTHQVNITALTGVFPASGEMIVVRVSEDDVEVLARLVPHRNE